MGPKKPAPKKSLAEVAPLRSIRKQARLLFDEILQASGRDQPWDAPSGNEVNSSAALETATAFMKIIGGI
jgi:hypothetical protein